MGAQSTSTFDLTHGSRWWKMDFHAHTPHSSDWQKDVPDAPIGKDAPREWLRRYMEASIDAVAVTDHNGGGYIDPLKTAYAELAADPPDWFRSLTLFPGVEITVANDFHLLGIFDPSVGGQKITRVLGQAGIDCDEGDAGGHTTKPMEEVCGVIVENGGVAIPAHVDETHGLLQWKKDSASCEGSSRSVGSLVKSGLVHAFELSDLKRWIPQPARCLCRDWPCVIGSDWHNWKGNPEREPGQRFTWVKMGRLDIEGLMLALQEGFPGSIRRCDEVDEHPIDPPASHLRRIRVEQARYAGRDSNKPLGVPFSPWLTTLIGGRGSGKSTVVQMLRLALDRGGELSGDVLEDFENFARTGSRAEEDGALTGDTRIEVDYVKNGQVYRLGYAYGQPGLTVREVAEDDTESPADGNSRDFPVRIFGQKQIYHLAGDTAGLLSLIDETSEVDRAGWEIDWNKAIAEYRATRARARAERATTTEMTSLRHRLSDIEKQLEVFERGDNRSTLQGYQRLRSQERRFEIRAEQSAEAEVGVRTLLEGLAPPDPPLAAFDGEGPADEAGRELMRAAARDQQTLVDAIRTAVDAYSASVNRWKADLASSPWSDRLGEQNTAYAALIEQMAASGIEDPGGYTDLVRDKQLVESRLASAVRAERNAERIDAEAAVQLDAILKLRKDLTRRRHAFLGTLPENDHVRVEIRGFGDSAESAEASFRDAVGKPGNAFANDIRSEDGARGLLAGVYDLENLADDEDRDAVVLARIDIERSACLAAAESDDGSRFGAHFTRHLRELGAEQLDHLRTWWPEDDVHVLYRDANKRFRPIRRASAGEKSAAVLAFILGHGEEPLILDQPEDDLDNHLIFQLVVKALGRIKRRRQVIVVTHNPNIVVNGAAELVNAMAMPHGQIVRNEEGSGCLQDPGVRREVCDVMEGGREAFERRYRRVVRHIDGGAGVRS